MDAFASYSPYIISLVIVICSYRSGSASIAMISVIVFVMDAGYIRSAEFRDQRI